MTEPCDLTAVEARRLIGQKKLAPTELLDKLHRPHRGGGPCGERHGRARLRPRPRRPRRRPMRPWRAATICRRCTACRSASRTCRTPRACAPPTAARSSATTSPRPTNASSAAVRAGRRDRRRQDQHAGIRRRREHAQRGLWRDRQSVRSHAVRRRLLGRLGGGAGHRHGADLLRLRHRRVAAQSRRVLRHRRLPPDAGPGRQRAARARLEQPLGRRADGAHRAGPVPAALRHGQRRCARPAGDHGAWPHGAPAGGLRGAGAHRPVAPARRAHAGFRLRADRAPHRRGVRREDRPVPPRLRAAPRTPRRTAPAPTRRSRCCAPSASWPAISEKVRTRPQDVGPNVRANVEEGLRYTAADVARAQSLQTALYRRWQAFFQRLGRDPDALDHHQPAAMARTVSRRRSTASRRAPISTGWRWPMR